MSTRLTIRTSSGAAELLDEYFESVGGEDFVKAGGKTKKKRGRASTATSTHKGNNAKRQKGASNSKSATPQPNKKEDTWVVPSGSWEEEVLAIDAIEEVEDDFQVYLHWTNGRRTQHPREMCNRRCPQKVDHYIKPLFLR